MYSDDEGGIGFGRTNGSSSSRESSPALRRQKRSFTPTSDDGDLVIPTTVPDVDETPPPENAPIIRQALGFSAWAPESATTINTYQATLPAQTEHWQQLEFLPGQKLDGPPKSTRAKKAPAAKSSSAKPRATRKKKTDAFSAQTGRFKLSTISRMSCTVDESLNVAPAPVPYKDPFYPVSGPDSLQYMVGTASTTTVSSMESISPSPSAPPPDSRGRDLARAAQSSSSRMNRPSYDTPPSRSKGKQAREKHPPTTQATHDTPTSYQSPSQQNADSSNHDRRNHENDRNADNMHSLVPPSHASTSVPTTNNAMRPEPLPWQGQSCRILTILIEDIRSGVADLQLAEVRVPLKQTGLDDPEYGYWAIAHDVCEALQASPSRIDGPAKVYTLRGKFRQIFMRVTADDSYQADAANLRVTSERILEIVVDTLLPPGQLPPPPRILDFREGEDMDIRQAKDKNVRRDEDSESEADSTGPIHVEIEVLSRDDQMERLARKMAPGNKRARSSSSDRLYRTRPVAHISPYSSPSCPPSPSGRRNKKQRGTEDATHSETGSQAGTPGSMMASFEEAKEEAIANYIRPSIEGDPAYCSVYMQSKAKPQRVNEILIQYNFVYGKFRELQGQRTPQNWEGAAGCAVTKDAMLRVFKLTMQWYSGCEETLTLVKFYGPNGSRYEDSRVGDMINDTAPPHEKDMKHRFLKLLRRIDMDWLRDHTEPHAEMLPESDGTLSARTPRFMMSGPS